MSWGCLTGLTYTIKLLQVQREPQLSPALLGGMPGEQRAAPGAAAPSDSRKTGLKTHRAVPGYWFYPFGKELRRITRIRSASRDPTGLLSFWKRRLYEYLPRLPSSADTRPARTSTVASRLSPSPRCPRSAGFHVTYPRTSVPQSGGHRARGTPRLYHGWRAREAPLTHPPSAFKPQKYG